MKHCKDAHDKKVTHALKLSMHYIIWKYRTE